ncbi:glycerate kinase [Virgibacillus natechei]|uniref:Glycerate kinase n=1 Tax=Virgibacillus natechei TaxID=1216297 RepID=A0ABS4IE80_9BACI|nr:glycerate kinase [Virgibacillus natechei]MBP1969243.1 glycerate kinase [Virgibacillus natechei]UZD12404.1 glycerate kinase [Virgibacillus natechei]
MNIVLAPDSYKGSLTSIQVSEIMKNAILEVNRNHHVIMKPMADGGEGTLQALLTSMDGENIPITCTGPLGKKISTNYAIVNSKTAIIEFATIAGLIQVPVDERNPDYTTSFGVGEVMIDALNKGCTSFVISLGGSATNDGGLGMLLALGMKAWDENREEIGAFGKDLKHVKKVSFTKLDARLAKSDIKVACDVSNPLCGEQGASEIFAPQKGATKKQVVEYDEALNHFGDLVEAALNKPMKEISGSGAAGGVGFALLAMEAHLVSGAQLLANAMNIEQAVKKADLVITGEGQSDEQTLFGKAPGYIASLAKKHSIPVILISGSLTGDLNKLRDQFSGCFSIINQPHSLEECMDQANIMLYEQTKQVIQLVASIRDHTLLER